MMFRSYYILGYEKILKPLDVVLNDEFRVMSDGPRWVHESEIKCTRIKCLIGLTVFKVCS